MEELHKFVYGTVVCDGCACRIDSRTADGDRIHDKDSLVEYKLEDLGWIDLGKDKWLCPECAKSPSHRTHPGEGRVIAERETVSGLRCDLCGKSFEDFEGFSVWEDFSDTQMHANDDDWQEIDGRWLCPDCYRSCDAIEDEEEENYEEVYCSKCSHKDDCNEVEERTVPDLSLDCKSAVKSEPCPFYAPNNVKGLRGTCNLPKDKKCPRVEAWEVEKEEVAKKNKEIKEWVKKSDN